MSDPVIADALAVMDRAKEEIERLRARLATAGRIKRLAENIRACAQNVMHEMKLSPGGDLYTYEGSTGLVDALQEALAAYEEGVEP